jgi:M6 family metalloprotease-like protein
VEVVVNSYPARVAAGNAHGANVTVVLASRVFNEDQILVSYRGYALFNPANQPIRDVLDQAVTNLAAAGCTPRLAGPFENAQPPPVESYFLPSTGTIRAVMLFVDFPNDPASTETSAHYHAFADSEAQWFAQVSYGHADIQITQIPTWIRMPRPSSDYNGWYRLGAQETQVGYIRDAIAAADPQVDFSQYQIVYVIAAPQSGIPYGNSFFRPKTQPMAVADGNAIQYALAEPADIGGRIVSPGYMLVHETVHMFGLPDLYDEAHNHTVPDPAAAFDFIGSWDIMSDIDLGPGLVAWQRWTINWLDGNQIRCLRDQPLEADLTPLGQPGGLKMLVAPISPTQALVVENRQPIGVDSNLCGAGVLVYTVDSTIGTFLGPIVAHPAADSDSGRGFKCGYLYAAPYGAGASYTDPSGIRVDILSQNPDSYHIRISRP